MFLQEHFLKCGDGSVRAAAVPTRAKGWAGRSSLAHPQENLNRPSLPVSWTDPDGKRVSLDEMLPREDFLA